MCPREKTLLSIFSIFKTWRFSGEASGLPGKATKGHPNYIQNLPNFLLTLGERSASFLGIFFRRENIGRKKESSYGSALHLFLAWLEKLIFFFLLGKKVEQDGFLKARRKDSGKLS